MRLFTLCLIIFLDSLGVFITLPLLLRYIYSDNFLVFNHAVSAANKNILFGLLLGLTSFFGAVLTPFIGYLSDLIGRKKVLFLSLSVSLLASASMLLGFSWNNLFLLFAANALAGIAETSQPVAEAAIIDASEGKRRAYQIGLIAFSMVLAMAMGPALGAHLSDRNLSKLFNLNTPLYLSMFLSLVNMLLLLATYRDVSKHRIHKVRDRFLKAVLVNLKGRGLQLYYIAFFAMQFSWALFFQSVSLTLMREFHASVNHIGDFLMSISLMMAFGLLAINYVLLQKLTAIKITYGCFMIAAICYFALWFPVNFYFMFAVSIVLAIVVGLYYPSLVLLMTERNRQDLQGYLMGFNTALMIAAWSISGIMVGYLANFSVRIHCLLEAVCALLALFVVYLSQRQLLRP